MPKLVDSTDVDFNQSGDELKASKRTTDEMLKEWTEGGDYEATSITRDSDGVVSSADVVWPDGSAGTYTMTTKNSTWICADAFTLSHTDSSKTVEQAAVTRNSDGEVTTKPALTVA